MCPTTHGCAGPTGQLYYHNAQTKESTYVRPWPSFRNPPVQLSKKKEKPLVKTPIPGTEWIRVKTTEGNIFYSHQVKKESYWTVPETIREAVDALEAEERTKQGVKVGEEDVMKAGMVEEEHAAEIKRIKSEVQEILKRKAENVVPVDEVGISKKARVEDAPDEEDSSDEEDWQREATAQLAAAEAKEENKQIEEEEKRTREEAEAEARKLKMPERVDLSMEEAKALFKVTYSTGVLFTANFPSSRPFCTKRM
jgi:hypothetical protein